MRIRLPYGTSAVTLDVPDERVAGVWQLRSPEPRLPSAHCLGIAREELERCGALHAATGARLGLLLADGTRSWSPELLLPSLRFMLESAGSVEVFVCPGTHDPGLPETMALLERVRATLSGLDVDFRLHVPDARSDRGYVRLGRTSRGTPIELFSPLLDCSVFLVAADMKPHYFAGYSNPVKYWIPGLTSVETARANHAWALDPGSRFGRHPWHPDPGRRENPLAEDMVEAFEHFIGAREHFALCTVSGDHEQILWAGGGHTADVSARGMRAVDRITSLEVEPVRYLVVSAGGAPYDESLYTSQRALELSREAVRPNGEVLFLASCTNGIGPPSAHSNFYRPLTRPLASIESLSRAEYVLYAHKPVKLARLIRRLAALHMVSELPDASVEAIHLRPAAVAQARIDAWLREARPEDRIGFVLDGSKLGLHARP